MMQIEEPILIITRYFKIQHIQPYQSRLFFSPVLGEEQRPYPEQVMACTAHLCNLTCIGGGDDYRQQGNMFVQQGFCSTAVSNGDMISPVDGRDC